MAITTKFTEQQLTKKQMNLVRGGAYLATCMYYHIDGTYAGQEQLEAPTLGELIKKMNDYQVPEGYYHGLGGCQYNAKD